MLPSAIVHRMLDCEKQNLTHLFVREPHTIQIIQLVEAPPPPPRIAPSSASSSSCPSTSSSEEDCSSYCSSVVTPDESSHHRDPIPWTDDTYNTRMGRVHAWRDGFVKATADPRPSPLKRKMTSHQPDDDTLSHSSKRSRSRDGHSISRLTAHPCPACDALFPTLSSLRRHGRDPHIPEACRAAVAYNFE